ncbi:MAG: hypothetical protein HS104_09590 [Polyangiaceae bacterium]|nr:hypothetical protein [Polyangiaceae bacterium]MCE7890764.1 hypothetical protein [Sorangiineae bacterium PRO1]MCL4754339.1 hypothetical protein [Myxococcales bacterium]
MTATRTLVPAAGELLRARGVAGSRSVVLEVVRPGQRPHTWRVVWPGDVADHAARWAAERGIAPPVLWAQDGPSRLR